MFTHYGNMKLMTIYPLTFLFPNGNTVLNRSVHPPRLSRGFVTFLYSCGLDKLCCLKSVTIIRYSTTHREKGWFIASHKWVGLSVEGSARQGWMVDWAPTDLQNGPTNGGVINIPLLIKLLSTIESPGLKPKGRVCMWRADAPALSNRTGLGWNTKRCRDWGLGVLTTHETSPWFSLGDAGSTCPGWIPPQVRVKVSVRIFKQTRRTISPLLGFDSAKSLQ